MRVWPRNRYVPGTYKRECDVCGQDFLRSEMLRRWDGKIVCSEDFEEKDPQLETRVHKERHIQIDSSYSPIIPDTFLQNNIGGEVVLLNNAGQVVNVEEG